MDLKLRPQLPLFAEVCSIWAFYRHTEVEYKKKKKPPAASVLVVAGVQLTLGASDIMAMREKLMLVAIPLFMNFGTAGEF